MSFETKKLPIHLDYLAPDGSEIRKLPDLRAGGLSHCTLPPRSVSQAMTHRTVDEIWYFIEGQGEMWRKLGSHEEIVRVHSTICLTIPVGTHFQFRNLGSRPLRFIIATMPPWPGAAEAVKVKGIWPAT